MFHNEKLNLRSCLAPRCAVFSPRYKVFFSLILCPRAFRRPFVELGFGDGVVHPGLVCGGFGYDLFCGFEFGDGDGFDLASGGSPSYLVCLVDGVDDLVGDLAVAEYVVHDGLMVSVAPLYGCVGSVHEFLLGDVHGFGDFGECDGIAGLVEELKHGVVAVECDACGEGDVLGLMSDPFEVESESVPCADLVSVALHVVEIIEEFVCALGREVQCGLAIVLGIPDAFFAAMDGGRRDGYMKRGVLVHILVFAQLEDIGNLDINAYELHASPRVHVKPGVDLGSSARAPVAIPVSAARPHACSPA